MRYQKVGATSAFLGLIASFMALGLGACAKVAQPKDQEQLKVIVEKLKSGELVRAIEKQDQRTAGENKSDSSTPAIEQPAEKILPSMEDPCPRVANPGPEATEPQRKAALQQLGQCMREQLKPARILSQVIAQFRIFELEKGSRPISQLTEQELSDFVTEFPYGIHDLIGVPYEKQSRVRNQFTDADLEELVQLAIKRRAALREAELKIYVAISKREPLLQYYAKSNVRYRALLALRDTWMDEDGQKTFFELERQLVAALPRVAPPVPAQGFPMDQLHPFAILAIVPERGAELTTLSPDFDNPYLAALQPLAELGGRFEVVRNTRATYVNYRAVDNPPVPKHETASAGAIRVAFMDRGVDFVKYPELGYFLGSSRDFADADENPWLPAIGRFAHGSGTMATLLTILSHQAPDLLISRKIDLAMYKVGTLRSLLGGQYQDLVSWDSRDGLHDGLYRLLSGAAGVPPQIVSVSMMFSIRPTLARLQDSQAIRKAPWLWVMSAGNEGRDLGEMTAGRASCFSDLKPELRPSERILCVGALLQGVLEDRIAGYSNHGEQVDVYAYQSYIDLCPNGTSCAAPSITAAATIIGAQYPDLSAAQIRQVIVETAEERLLSVDFNEATPEIRSQIEAGTLETVRKVKVFDPRTMMERALKRAAELTSS